MNKLRDKKLTREYWLTLGQFISTFSAVEQRLHNLLWLMAGIDHEALRAFLPDTRFGNVSSTINRLNRSRDSEEHPLLRRAIDQIGLIAKARNLIVHQPSALTDRGLIISNLSKAMPDSQVEMTVSVEMLKDMTADLKTASACISMVVLDSIKLPPNAKPLLWNELSQRPWLYKPSKTQQQGQRPRQHARKQQRQRQSSDE